VVGEKKMARPTKENSNNQRNSAVVVYLPPDLRRWIEQRAECKGDSLSRTAKEAILEYAKSEGFEEPKPESENHNDEVSLIARQLNELTEAIKRMTKDAKCFALYI
jgi:hypothetical protein